MNKIKVYVLGNFEVEEDSEIRSVVETLSKPLKGTGESAYEVKYPSNSKVSMIEEFKKLIDSNVVYSIRENPHNMYSRQMMGICNTLGITILDAYTKQEIVSKEIIITTKTKQI